MIIFAKIVPTRQQVRAIFVLLSFGLALSQTPTLADPQTVPPAAAPRPDSLASGHTNSHSEQRRFKGQLNPETFATEWDFGFVPVGYNLIYKTSLLNVGQDTLQLLDIVSTCECTTPKAGRDIIPPDSTASLTISFNTEKFSGLQSRFVEVHSTDSHAAERLLQFRAVVGGRPPEVAMLPKSMLLLSGQAGDSLVIKNYTTQDILFHPAFLDSELFELGTEFDYVPADGYTHLYLSALDSVPAGEHYSTLTVQFETDPPTRISVPIKLIRR